MSVDLLSKLLVQFGLPTVLAVGFCYWFFVRHLPSLEKANERRFGELKKAHTESLLAQERAQETCLENQNIIFEKALSQIIETMNAGFSKLSQDIKDLQSQASEPEYEKIDVKKVKKLSVDRKMS